MRFPGFIFFLVGCILQANAFQKSIPLISINSPSNGLKGTSLQLSLNKGGSTGAVTWSVDTSLGDATLVGDKLTLDDIGTVRLRADIAEDANYSAFHVVKFITINATDTRNPGMAQIWGSTSYGGNGGGGVIFRMNLDGTGYTVMNEFGGDSDGASGFYNAPMIASDGNIYGTLSEGGTMNGGVLYRYKPSDKSFTILRNFVTETGYSPTSPLVEASDGKLYGTCNQGGLNGVGVFFKFDKSNNTYTVIEHFERYTTGVNPVLGVREINGKLYGCGFAGGQFGGGILFDYDLTSKVFTARVDFAQINASYSYAPPSPASNGKLYGVTAYGGNSGGGKIYEYDPSTQQVVAKWDVDISVVRDVIGGFSKEVDGKMYAIGLSGGTNFRGSIIEYVPGATSVTSVVEFTEASGGASYSPLLLAANGSFYTLAAYGPSGPKGAIYEFNPATKAFTLVRAFTEPEFGLSGAGLAEDANGLLYGVSNNSTANGGALFTYNRTTSELKILKPFFNSPGGYNPGNTMVNNGTQVFVTAHYGGFGARGTLNTIDVQTNSIRKSDFAYNTGGNTDGIMLHSNGKVYGVMLNGGSSGYGTIVELNPTNGEMKSVFDFPGYDEELGRSIGSDQAGPYTEGPDGLIYGIGRDGKNYNGIIYSFNPISKEFKVVYDFNNSSEGAVHKGLTRIGDKLYGIAQYGGDNGNGGIYTYDPATSTVDLFYSFGLDEGDANHPFGPLTKAANGKFYGLASGGEFNLGTVYELDPQTNEVAEVFSFNEYVSQGALIRGNAGKLIVATETGGDNGLGGIYEFDPSNPSVTRKVSFSSTTGYRSQSIWTVVRLKNEITFEIADKNIDDPAFNLESITDGEGDVTYTALTDNITIDGNETTIVKAGRATIKASQDEGDNYSAATAEASFCINPAKPSITLTGAGTSAVTLTSNVESGNTWYRDGTSIGTTKAISVSENGTYYVEVAADDCKTKSDEQVLVVTGLKDDISNLFRVYPNPVSTELLIDLPDGVSAMQVSLVDYLGRPIESRTAQPQTTEKFQVAHLPASVYIVRVAREGKTISKVFIKK